ncbi:MAG TPA: hypothetical protein VGG75_00145 [Trebonia sp.]|jgi:hypothetical protein
MNTSTASEGLPVTAGRTMLAVVFAIVALVLIAAGVVIGFMPDHTLPAIIDGAWTGHHPLRAVGSVLVGTVFAVASWYSLRYQGPAVDSE